MKRLTDLLFQGGSIITLIVLEFICFYLIINFNSSQREIWLETVSVYTGSVNENVSSIGGYMNLKAKVDSLNERIAHYKQATEGMYIATSAQVDSIRDDSLRQRYLYRTAEVVNRSPYSPYNTCIINRGRQDSIKIGQGVVGDIGLLGIVTAVSDEHARVMTMLHRDVRLTAGLKNNYFGTLRWEGKDPRFLRLDDLKDYVPLSKGDTVYTTGYSSVFPSGLPIGTISTAEKLPGTGNWQLIVELLRDPLQMRNVFAIQDLYKEDIAKLLEEE